LEVRYLLLESAAAAPAMALVMDVVAAAFIVYCMLERVDIQGEKVRNDGSYGIGSGRGTGGGGAEDDLLEAVAEVVLILVNLFLSI
jgi:hypothetical protein